jgi:hypothetical protein
VLAFHDAYRDMLRMEGVTELDPLHLVSRTSSGETGPPCSSIA